MFFDRRYLRRCLIALASLVCFTYVMLNGSAGQESQEDALRQLLHRRTLELINSKGLSPENAMEIFVTPGTKEGAEAYYRRISKVIGFARLEDPNSNLDDLLNYLGYKGLTARDLEELASYDLMPTTDAEFRALSSKVKDPALFSANRKLADFLQDRVLLSRFFAPKIVNYGENNTAPGSQNPFVAGWRKLVRLRATALSDANKAGIAEAYILFNVFEALETKDPFLNESGNNQIILVPKSFSTAPGPNARDSAFWMVYEKRSLGYRLGYALKAAFDLPGPGEYFVPVACAQCHGHDKEYGSPLGEVFPYAKVNFLDTDQWYDMLDYDFPGTKIGPHDVVFDSNKTRPGTTQYERAFGVLRKLNEGALKQNRASKRPGTANDFRIKAAEKWIDAHKTTSAPVPPIARAIDMGGGVVWTKTAPNDILLLGSLNRFCFRCHSSLLWNVFDKGFVLDRRAIIGSYVRSGFMPQGRRILEPDKKALLDYLSKLK